MYKETELVSIGKRENNKKRNFLVINPLQESISRSVREKRLSCSMSWLRLLRRNMAAKSC